MRTTDKILQENNVGFYTEMIFKLIPAHGKFLYLHH